MNEISVSRITEVIERLCIQANEQLPPDIQAALSRFREEEDWETAECDSAISAWNLRKGDQETITESVNEKPLQEEQQTSFMENEETI